MITNATDPALQGAITFYSASVIARLDQIGYDAGKEAADFCSQWIQEHPITRVKGKFPEKEIPHFGKRSIVFAVAVMTGFVVWTQKKHGLPLPESPLLGAAEMGYNLVHPPTKDRGA